MKKIFLFIMVGCLSSNLISQPASHPIGSPGIADGCQINANCALGNSVDYYKNAVGLLNRKVDGFPNESKHSGTAFVVRQAGINGANILMTAAHSLISPVSDDYWIRFGYASTCNGTNPTNVSKWQGFWNNGYDSISGGDIQTIKLNVIDNEFGTPTSIPQLGWTLLDQLGSDVKTLGHPNGNSLKVTSYTSLYRTVDHNNDSWGMTIDQGGAQVGQSGSPVLNSAAQIVGVVNGEFVNCIANNPTGYVVSSRLSKYYRTFSEHLDPNKTGAVQVPTRAKVGGNWTDIGQYKYPSLSNTESYVCYGNKVYVTIENFCEFMVDHVTWNVSNSSLVTTKELENGKILEISPKYSSSSGKINVSAQIDFGSFSKTYWSIIMVGQVKSSLLDIDDSYGEKELIQYETIFGEAYYNGGSGADIGIFEYEWDIPYASDWIITQDGPGFIDNQYVEIEYWEDPAPSSETVKIRARNGCGWSSWKSTTWSVIEDGGYFFMFSPNPVEDVLTVERVPPDTAVSFSKSTSLEIVPYEVVLFNKEQQSVFREESNEKQIKINVSKLPKGTYFLHINSNRKSIKKQVLLN